MTRILQTLLATAAVGGALASLPALATDDHDRKPDHRRGGFGFDIAGDCSRFVYDNPSGGHLGPLQIEPDALPTFGATFMQEGVIYEAGTFEQHCPDSKDCGLVPIADAASDGAPGTPLYEPEFPEAVIGKWSCWGTFVGDGINTESGAWLVSTQVYDFDPEVPGEVTLVSHGSERVDLNVPFDRAITGGTGPYRFALGQVRQTKIGVNQSECENFTFETSLFPSRH